MKTGIEPKEKVILGFRSWFKEKNLLKPPNTIIGLMMKHTPPQSNIYPENLQGSLW